MDNKLSELSKPYGYEYVTAGRGNVVMSRTLPPVDMREVKPLYSQEYVSALQHESAVNWEAAASLNVENEELKRTLEAKDKRNAELHSTIERWATDRAESANQIDELEAKLATPVRLPEKFSMLHRTDFHEDYHSTMAFKSDEVFDAIRAAGFRCEGDE